MSKRRGRRRSADRKPRATTRAGRRPLIDRGTEQLLLKRMLLAGDQSIALDFPLLVMRARAVITLQQCNAGMAFAALAWSLYGEPFPGCEALYRRMVAGADDGAALSTYDDRRERGREASHRRMVSELRRAGETRRMLTLVCNVAQYCHPPAWFLHQLIGKELRAFEVAERDLLIDGFKRLVTLSERRTRSRAA